MKTRAVPLIALAVAAMTLAATAWRLRFGVDFTDEAFYLAVPLRFLLGDRPFVDDLSMSQGSALIVLPFVALHHLVARGTTGLLLYARILWLVLACVVGSSIFRCFRRAIAWPAALLIAALSVAWMPYNVAALSYNTLGSCFWTLGIFVAVAPLIDAGRERRWELVLAGAAHGLAALSYPTLAIPALLFALLIVMRSPEARLRRFAAYAVGGALASLVIAPSVIRAGTAGLVATWRYASTGGVGGAANAIVDLKQLWNAAPHPALLAIPIALFMIGRRRPTLACCLLPGVALLATRSAWRDQGILRGNAFVIYFGLLAPLLAFAVENRKLGRTLAEIALTSFVAGAITASTSTNGTIAAALGLFPACVASAVLLAAWIAETARRSQRAWLERALALSPAVVLPLMVSYLYTNDAVYRDGPIAELTAPVERGPFRGLYTTSAKRELLYEISDDALALARRLPPSERALFYWDFPAGYLIVDRRPAACCAWVFDGNPRVYKDAACFRAADGGKTLVVKLTYGAPWLEHQQTALDFAVQERTELVTRRPQYTLSLGNR